MDRYLAPTHTLFCGALLLRGLIFTSGCAPGDAGSPVLQADVPLHLEEHLDAASLEGSEGPSDVPATVEWRFDQAQPDWKPTLPLQGSKKVELERTTDALRVTLLEASRISDGSLGGIYVDLPDWRREEWAKVVVVARTTSSVNSMSIGLNPREGVLPAGATQATFEARGGVTPIVRDGSIHTYRIHLDWGSQRTGPWQRVGLHFKAPQPGSIDILSVRVLPAAAEQTRDRVTETTLEPPQLKSDFALFRKALEEAHPALYRYTTKREMDAAFASAEANLTRPMTLLQFRNVLAPVLASIRDGHTGFAAYQGDEISSVLASARQFPLALAFDWTRAVVLLNQGLDERVKPGMEVVAINGQSVEEILQRILPNLTRDGDVRTFQMYQLGMWAADPRSRGFFQVGRPGRTGFSEAYRLYVSDPLGFQTTLRDRQTQQTIVVDLAGVTDAEAAVNLEENPVNRDVLTGLRTLRIGAPRQAIRFLDGEDTAVLTPGFQGDFPDFLEKTFAELGRRGTGTLIIDMRGNTGGNDVYPGLLFSYLTSQTFRSNHPSYMKTFQPSFIEYSALAEIDPVTDPYYGTTAGLWTPDPRGGWLMTEKYPMVGMREPADTPFDGTVYVLMDGGTFSAASAFTATADFYERAIFVGEETGGVGGGAGGSDVGPTLPKSLLHTGFAIEAEYTVVAGSNRRGTLPTYAVKQTIDDLTKGRDTVLEFTRELIRSGNVH
jgi:hypothetical protein